MKKIALLGIATAAMAVSACSRNRVEELPPPPPQQVARPAPAPAPTPAPTGPAAGSQAHFAAAMAGRDVIYFDTDRFNIDNEDAAALRAQAQYLLQHTAARATIEGHADERGTREYNLALGERRANAAKNYLVSLGVPENRLRTVSYGEERPVATESNEQAWARNRRAVTVMLQ
ncbi:MAG: peptidoglycan-associated lipoprotein Pal [Alteraurantiacibacter sp.]|nr:peptidoglycan-associated lipoprotein Pal [Alteraurantiacibacter sp.]